MPSDPEHPEHPIDALLGAYAEQRRRSAPAEPRLHPATRQMLQAEVRRLRPAGAVGGAPVRSRGWARLWALWPRIAVAGGLAAALALGIWWSFPALTGNEARSGQVMLAKKVTPVRPPAGPTSAGSGPGAAPLADSTPLSSTEAAEAMTAPAPGPARAALPAPAAPVTAPPAPSRPLAPAASPAPAPLERYVREKSDGLQVARTEPLPAIESAPTSARVAKAVDSPARRGAAASAAGATPPAIPASEPAATVALAASAPSKAAADADMADGMAMKQTVAKREPGLDAPPKPVTSLTSASSAPRAGLVQQGVFFNQGAVPGSGGEARMNYRGAAPAVGGRADAGAASGVLTRFTVEQQGAILRVIDGDGSVYEGRFLDASASAGLAAGTGAESELAVSRVRSRSVAATRGGVPVSGVGAAASNVVAGVGAGQPFEVTGSNRTLRTRVIFTGFSQVASNAAETGNAPRTELADDRKALESVRSFSVNRAPAPIGTTLTIQRLQGQVQWGRTNRLGIDAVRVAP